MDLLFLVLCFLGPDSFHFVPKCLERPTGRGKGWEREGWDGERPGWGKAGTEKGRDGGDQTREGQDREWPERGNGGTGAPRMRKGRTRKGLDGERPGREKVGMRMVEAHAFIAIIAPLHLYVCGRHSVCVS